MLFFRSHRNRTSVTDAQGNVTTFAYDAGDRLITITYPPAQSGGSSTTSTFTYDSRGRRTSATDQNGKTTSYAYDTADRMTTVTDAASNVTTYTYDTENNLLGITDANGHTTNFTYDAFGRVTQTTFPSSFYESYAYAVERQPANVYCPKSPFPECAFSLRESLAQERSLAVSKRIDSGQRGVVDCTAALHLIEQLVPAHPMSSVSFLCLISGNWQ
jgi:YD repeat-containing protein